jgi:hypothetical protein
MKKFVQIQEPISNPQADKRTKYDWRKFVQFPAGMQIIVDTTAKELFPVDSPGATLPLADPRSKKILKVAEAYEPGLKDVLVAHNTQPGKVLTRLVKKGMISIDDVQKVLR